MVITSLFKTKCIPSYSQALSPLTFVKFLLVNSIDLMVVLSISPNHLPLAQDLVATRYISELLESSIDCVGFSVGFNVVLGVRLQIAKPRSAITSITQIIIVLFFI